MRKRFLSILFVVVSVMVMVMALSGCGSKKEDKEEKTATAEDAISALIDVVYGSDKTIEERFEVLKELTPNEAVRDEYLEYIAKHVTNTSVVSYKEKCGEDYKIAYKILKEEEIAESELEEIENALKKEYEGIELNFDGKAYRYEVEVTWSGSKNSESKLWHSMCVIKIAGKWYVVFGVGGTNPIFATQSQW